MTTSRSRAVCALLVCAALTPFAAAAKGTTPSSGGGSSSIDEAILRVYPDPDYTDDQRAELKQQVIDKLGDLRTKEQISNYFRATKGAEGDFVHDALQQILIGGSLGAAQNSVDKPETPANPSTTGGAAPPISAQPTNPAGPIATPSQLPPGFELSAGLAQQQFDRNPRDRTANLQLGMVKYFERDYRGAFDRFDQAYQSGDRSVALLTHYADSAFHLGDYATASAAARMVLGMDPGNKDALAIYHFSKDRAPVVNLPSAIGSTPNPLAGAPSYAAAPARPDLDAPRAPASAPGAGSSGAPPADAVERSAQFTKDAVNALKVRDAQTAYTLANQAVALNPQNAQALNFRAMALTQMNRYSDAVQDASAALTLAPGSAAVLQTRSWAFSKQGKYKEGLEDAEATLERDPQNAFAYQNLAFARAGLGDREGALDALRQSAVLDPRFQNKLERALQLPKDQDLTVLFDDGAAAAAPAPAPGSRERRFLRLALLSAVGGLLVALGVLHVVSASWRDRMRTTVRRALGSSVAVADPEGAASDAPAGSFWAQYQVVKEIGLGGMGVVYEATDRALERRVAVKKMRDEIRLDPDDRRRFVNEARTVAQLHHPNIVDIYGIVEDAGDVYLVFEFVDGRTLGDALKSGGPLDLGRARQLLSEMCAAVAHAHERGVIHRDLKPSNVMLTSDGRVKVMDFGIARQAKDAVTRRAMTNTIAGTPPYMAPEQEQGTVRKEADVYALGVCLYEMVTGQLPFTGSGAAMLLNKLNGKFVPASQRAPSLPPAFDAVIACALAPDPDKRFHGPAELLAALDALPVARAS